MGDLFDWALSFARGDEQWQDSSPRSWTEDTGRFFAAMTAFDGYLASEADLRAEPDRLFQGAVADALTHVGEVAMLRRLAGARVRAEDSFVGAIETGRLGADSECAH